VAAAPERLQEQFAIFVLIADDKLGAAFAIAFDSLNISKWGTFYFSFFVVVAALQTLFKSNVKVTSVLFKVPVKYRGTHRQKVPVKYRGTENLDSTGKVPRNRFQSNLPMPVFVYLRSEQAGCTCTPSADSFIPLCQLSVPIAEEALD